MLTLNACYSLIFYKFIVKPCQNVLSIELIHVQPVPGVWLVVGSQREERVKKRRGAWQSESLEQANTCIGPSYNLYSCDAGNFCITSLFLKVVVFSSGEDKCQGYKTKEDQYCQTDTKWGLFFKMKVELSVIQVTQFVCLLFSMVQIKRITNLCMCS